MAGIDAGAGRVALATGIGGALWALTPLRQPVFGAGDNPEQGVAFFRGYNLLIVAVAVLMTVGLLHLRRGRAAQTTKVFMAGWWIVLSGHVLLTAGSLPAVALGGQRRDFVMAAQDVGFLGAVVAALGALLLGVSALRRRLLPRTAAALFAATLPVGILGIVLLDGLGASEDVLGLPLTVLYGGAWVVLASAWMRRGQAAASANASV